VATSQRAMGHVATFRQSCKCGWQVTITAAHIQQYQAKAADTVVQIVAMTKLYQASDLDN